MITGFLSEILHQSPDFRDLPNPSSHAWSVPSNLPCEQPHNPFPESDLLEKSHKYLTIPQPNRWSPSQPTFLQEGIPSFPCLCETGRNVLFFLGTPPEPLTQSSLLTKELYYTTDTLNPPHPSSPPTGTKGTNSQSMLTPRISLKVIVACDHRETLSLCSQQFFFFFFF